MKRYGITLALLIGVLALLVSACVQPLSMPAADEPSMDDEMEATGGSEQTLYVGPTQADCVGVAPQLCLLVKEDPDADYTLFYDSIDGFTFVPGYEYELSVQVTPVENAPADASSRQYTLIEVVNQTEVGPTLEGTDWQLTALTDAEGNTVTEFAGNPITATFSDGSVNGSGGCNNYFASYTVDGDMLTIGMAGSTMMACPEPVMQQEQAYLGALSQVTRYAIVGEELRLLGDSMQPLLTYVARESAGLTGVTWEAIGVNNGRGGVASLIIGSEITAIFDDEGALSGDAGCNRYSTSYALDGDSISIGPSASTLMECPDPAGVMEQEQAYFQALTNAAVYAIDGDRLQLRDADGALQVDYRVAQDDDRAGEGLPTGGDAGADDLVQALGNLEYQNIAGMEDMPVQMTDGRYEGEPYVEGGAARPLAQVTDIVATGTIEGVPSAAVVVYSSTGGSGGFNNLALVQLVDGVPTNVGTVLLGDRGDINSVSIHEDQIVVDMVTQGPNDPMCCPTQQVLNTYGMVDGALTQTSSTVIGFVSPDGHAQMNTNLVGATWEWVEFLGGDGSTLIVENPTVYTLLLNPDASFTVKADCNYLSGTYNLIGSSLTFAPGPMTMAMCPPESLSDEYVRLLGDVVTYVLDGDVLYLNLKLDVGNMVFKPLGATPDTDEEVGTEQIQQALANLTYHNVAIADEPVTLVDGRFEGEPFVEGGASRPLVTLTDRLAFGRLTGLPSVATILVSDGGGTGRFYDLAVVQEVDGVPTNIATTLLGDRVIINTLDIEEDHVIVDMVTQGPTDAMCCPTQRVLNAYQLEDGELVQTTNAVIGYVDAAQPGVEESAAPAPTPTPAPEEEPAAVATSAATPISAEESTGAEPTATPVAEEEMAVQDELTPAAVASNALTLDPGVLAGSYHWRVLPATAFAADASAPAGAPAHILVSFDYSTPDDVTTGVDGRWIAVYPVDAYTELWNQQGDDTIATAVAALQALLAEQQPALDAAVPVVPPAPEINEVVVQPTFVDFAAGQGVRFVGRPGPDTSPIAEDQLVYVYQGLTDDGRYLVSIRWPVTTDAPRNAIADTPADQWTPSLNVLDALVNSLTLTLP